MRLSLNEDTFFFGSTPSLTSLPEVSSEITPPFIEELMADREIMTSVVRLVNADIENLETNMKLLRDGKNEEVFLKYYGKLLGTNLASSNVSYKEPDPALEEFISTPDESS
jgi:hypothetical protein